MATNTIEVSGLAKWINILDKKFDPAKRKTNLYPDKTSLEIIKKAGLKLRPKEDEDGVFYTFSRKDADGEPFVFLKGKKEAYEGKIGNGSIVTLQVEVYDTKSFGKGHRIMGIRIEKLIEYITPEGGEASPRKKPMPF